MNDSFDYDICIIGGGPGGYAAAMRAWDFGKKVCLIEKDRVGGAGIYNGALSSKTLWELSKDYRGALRKDRGYNASDVQLDYRQVVDCVNRAVKEKSKQMLRQLEEFSSPINGKTGTITLVKGSARFIDQHKVEIQCTEETSEQQSSPQAISAANFILATGSYPRELDSIDIDGKLIMTSDHVMNLDEFPKSMVILGAGVVGCEFATIFANFQQTKTFVIDRADRILPFEDLDISRICSNNLEDQGVTIHQLAQLISMKVVDGQVEYTIEHSHGGRETIRVDKALVSVGRIPNTNNLGLEEIGVKFSDRGHIVCENTQTSISHIYAVGDVTYDLALVSVAEIEGRHAVERICGEDKEPLDYQNLSTIMFLDPEIAAIGLNEQQAQDKKIPYRVAVYGYTLVNRAVAMRATDGFMKLLVSDDDEMRVLGMRALGVHASTTIEAASLMMKLRRSARDLAELFHPHPAITEGLQECVRMLCGTSIYKPSVFTSDLRLSRVTY